MRWAASFRMWVTACVLVCGVLWAAADPIPRPETRLPLAAAADLSSRLAAHTQHVQNIPDPRLPVPTPQDIEAIKKVAQILITLGQQVIPAIVGEPTAPSPMNCDPPEDAVDDSP
ncbi:uncharacterized protein LOC132902836 [Amyelois transitella]|uniref:uncharacterized protein LOC132902836 n=1 Tax=Amyelois transitella TaxID=680683 RepID=UPI002990721A|nr:uncharacterized protein LOC132902836 [Amyelois transitella]